MRSKIMQALLVYLLLLLAGCGSSVSSQAPPLVFPTQVQGPSGPAPLSLYFATTSSGASPTSTIISLDASNGKQRWTYTIPVQVQDDVFLDSGVLYFGTADQKVYALDAGGGRVRWSVKMSNFPVIAQVMDGVIYGTLVANVSDQFNGGTVFALNASNGTIKWHSQVAGTILGIVDGVIYVGGSTDNTLYTLNASDGSLRWKFQMDARPFEADVEQGVVYALATILNSPSPFTIIYALDASTGTSKWRYPADSHTQQNASLIGADANAVYLTSSTDQNPFRTNLALALKASNGSVLWRYQLTTQSHSFGTSALNNGMVYLGADDGNLYALDASDGKQRWQTKAGNSFISISLIDDRNIYVSLLQEGLAVFDSSSGSMRWHYQSTSSVQAVAVQNGLLYAVTFASSFSSGAHNYAIAFNIADGTIFWKYDGGETSFFPTIG